MIDAASAQLAELVDELSLVSRIESGRYEPTLREAHTLELAPGAAPRLGEAGVLGSVDVEVDGTDIRLSRVTQAAAPVVLGEDLRDLGAAVAARLVAHLGGS